MAVSNPRINEPIIQPVRIAKPDGLAWRPTGEGSRLGYMGSSFQQAHRSLRDTFGEYPLKLTAKAHLPVLKAMLAATGGHGQYKDLVAALEKHGEIEVIETGN